MRPLAAIRSRKTRTPWHPKPISTWVLLWVSLGAVAAGWWYYDTQMSQVDAVKSDGSAQVELEITRLRVETTRNMLAVAAGIGGASALVLSFRRQQHEEYNSTQQRITELRIQAVAQLGSDNPTVRIGGLHNLDRLGEQHEELRQIVLDEICSYLRLPYTPLNAGKGSRAESGQTEPADAAAPPDSTPSAEREVRFIAQEILQRRLRRGTDERPLWEHDRINLRSASLEHIDFRNCHLRNAAFTNATFSGDADFEFATFVGKTGFKGTTFGETAVFRNAIFSGITGFTDARFNGEAIFRGVALSAGADFEGSTFSRNADFGDSTFSRTAEFRDATFNGDANFGGAIFHGRSIFWRVALNRSANFWRVAFNDGTDFDGVTLNGETDFREAAFIAPLETSGALAEWRCVADPDRSGIWRLEPAAPVEPPTDRPDPQDIS